MCRVNTFCPCIWLQQQFRYDVRGQDLDRTDERECRGAEMRSVSGCPATRSPAAAHSTFSAEITDSTNQAKAVSLFPICLNGGMIAAAVLGGSLANTRGWAIARVIPIFETFPYLLPMVLASLFPLMSGTLAFCFLKETLPPKASLVVDELEEVAVEQGVANHQAPKQSKAPVRDLMTRQIILVVGAFAIMSLTVISLGALLPLFCFTPIEQGGLGMGSQSIGAIISSRSVVVLVIQVFCFPGLASRLGIVRLHRWAMSLWIPTFALLPMVNVAARAHQPFLVWRGLCIFMIVGSLAGMCQGE